MDASDTEQIRSLLAALLNRLEAGDAPVRVESVPARPGEGEIVLVVLGKVSSPTAAVASTHPGFEKFNVPHQYSSDSAPKTCFIEPDRVCVNSGACEMRGY